MPYILAARSRMAMSLAFHIVFACVGVAICDLTLGSERDYEVILAPHRQPQSLRAV